MCSGRPVDDVRASPLCSRRPMGDVRASHSEAATTADLLQSSPINGNNLPGIWPFLRLGDETCSNRITQNIFPLLRITLVIAQNVIKKSSLPNWGSNAARGDFFRQKLLQQSNPSAENEV